MGIYPIYYSKLVLTIAVQIIKSTAQVYLIGS